MKAWRSVLLSCVLGCAACADSCGCGPAATPSTGAGTSEGAAGHAASEVAHGTEGSTRGKRLESETPLPDGELKERIEEASSKVDWNADLGKTVSPKSLGDVLSDSIEGFSASGDVTTAQEQVDGKPAPVAVREYTKGRKTLRLKITDTASVPSLRQSVGDRLLWVGASGSGQQRGTVVEDAPGVQAFHRDARVSRAAAVLRGRYLVEAIVRETTDASDAVEVLAALDLDSLRAPK